MKNKTELPWKTYGTSIYGSHKFYSCIGTILEQDDADFIVRSSNSYYELLQACKEALKTMEATEDIGNHHRWHMPEFIRDMLYDAIASATGKGGI